MENKLLIAIDGPAGSGKSTVAKKLAAMFDIGFLDTGLIYRAVASTLLCENADISQEAAAVRAAKMLKPGCLSRDDLHTPEVSEATSIIAAYPALRRELLDVQRKLANQGRGNVVVGRDIGTVVLPECPIKVFLTASLQIRAQRRTQELQRKGIAIIERDVLSDLARRDKRDESRVHAPSLKPQDAVTIDTTTLDIDQAVNRIAFIVQSWLKGAGQEGLRSTLT